MATVTKNQSFCASFSSKLVKLEVMDSAISQTEPILVVFDRRVADLDILYQALLPDTIHYTIDPDQDGLIAITQLLTQTGAKRLAIVAHGEPGVVHLGADPLDLAQIERRSGLLQEWSVEEIALYSCEVAQDDRFIATLARSTGAKVSGAIDKVGAVVQGGSWKLDAGWAVDSPWVVEQLVTYTGVLADVTASSGSDNFDGTGLSTGTTNTSSGNDTITVSNSNQLNTGDVFNGGGGTDTINITGGTATYTFTGITISNVENLTAGNNNQTVILTASQFAGFSTIDLGAGGSDDLVINVTGTVDLSAGNIPTLSNIETVNITGGGGSSTDSITLTGAQLNAILSGGSGTIDLGNGTDTINLTSTSTQLNSLSNARLLGVEAVSAAGAASGVTINLGTQSEGFTITGSGSADTITGGAGNDSISAGGGNDTINGFSGTDTVL